MRCLSSKLAVAALTVCTVVLVTLVTRALVPRLQDLVDLPVERYGFRQLAVDPPALGLHHLSKLVAGSSSRDTGGKISEHVKLGPAQSSSKDIGIASGRLPDSKDVAHFVDVATAARAATATTTGSASILPTFFPVGPKAPLLLPVLPFGPNNQFRAFRDALVLAQWLNRTLLVPPFFKHHTAAIADGEEETVEAENIFDWSQLASLQPLLPWKEWRRRCGTSLDVIFQFTTVNQRGLFVRIQKLFQIAGVAAVFSDTEAIREPREVAANFKAVMSPQEAQQRFPSSGQCAVLLFPYRHVDISHNTLELALHLRRGKRLQRLAAHFVATAMGSVGEAFAVLHWRYNNEWGGVWCHQPVDGTYTEGKLTNPNYRPICRSIVGLNVTRLSYVLSQFLRSRQIRHVYVATPVSDFTPLMAALRASLPHMASSRDLLAAVGEKNSALQRAHLSPISSNFELSIVEQELATIASTFIGSKQSTWSSNVEFERRGLMNRMPAFKEPVVWVNDLL